MNTVEQLATAKGLAYLNSNPQLAGLSVSQLEMLQNGIRRVGVSQASGMTAEQLMSAARVQIAGAHSYAMPPKPVSTGVQLDPANPSDVKGMLAKVPDPWAQGDFTLWSTEHTEYSDWSSAYDQTTPIAISPDDEARLKANSLFHQVPSMLTSKADQVKRMEQQAAMRARMSVDPAYAASIRPEDLDPAPAIVREDVSRLLSERLTDTTIWEERTAFGNERTIGQFDFLRPTPVTPAQLQTATGGKPVDVLGGVPVGYADWEYDTDPTRAKYAYIEMHA